MALLPFDLQTETSRINALLKNNSITELQFFELEITRWLSSDERKSMLNGALYYAGGHDILDRKREVIGEDGTLTEVENLPNNRIVDNQYAKMVDQKVNYLLGKPIAIDAADKGNEAAVNAITKVLNKAFHRTLKNTYESALNSAIGWLYPYYAEDGTLAFSRFEGYEILPFWIDADHTKLDAAARVYSVVEYTGTNRQTVEKVEIYKTDGIYRYNRSGGSLTPDTENPKDTYITMTNGKGYNWERIPLIPFKYNNTETTLISRVKSLQDGINLMLSDFENNMQEDARNTILVVKNYDGADLGEFRHNLALYGAVKVRTIDGADGGVETLTVTVDAENYKAIIEVFKKALIENARGYDAKDDRMAENPNQMNIQSMYSDIDLDANGTETEFQAALEDLLWFVKTYLNSVGKGDYTGVDIDVVFNRDVLINESESIDNCAKSAGIISDETILTNHPWVTDVDAELERIKAKDEENINSYNAAFGTAVVDDTADEDGLNVDE